MCTSSTNFGTFIWKPRMRPPFRSYQVGIRLSKVLRGDTNSVSPIFYFLALGRSHEVNESSHFVPTDLMCSRTYEARMQVYDITCEEKCAGTRIRKLEAIFLCRSSQSREVLLIEFTSNWMNDWISWRGKKVGKNCVSTYTLAITSTERWLAI